MAVSSGPAAHKARDDGEFSTEQTEWPSLGPPGASLPSQPGAWGAPSLRGLGGSLSARGEREGCLFHSLAKVAAT